MILNDYVIQFREWDCMLEVTTYANNGRIALNLIEVDSPYELVACATVNLPDVELSSREVLIKDWSENEGIVEALQQAGVIGPVLDMVPTGFTAASKHELLI